MYMQLWLKAPDRSVTPARGHPTFVMGSVRSPPPAMGIYTSQPPRGWIVAGYPNRPPELLQLVDIWGQTPRWWRTRGPHHFSGDATGLVYLVPIWGTDDVGMHCVVIMVLIWERSVSDPACPCIICT